MDIFFVLSGLVLSLVYNEQFSHGTTVEGYLRFLALRLGRIYPLHLATFLASAAMLTGQIIWGRREPDYELFRPYDAIMSLGLVHAWGTTDRLAWNGVSWSISAEWFAYLFLLIPIAYLLRQIDLRSLTLIVFASWAALFLFFIPYTDSRNLDFTYNFGILRVSVEFLAGYLIFRLWRFQPASLWFSDLAVVSSLALLILASLFPDTDALILPMVCALLYGLVDAGPLGRIVFGNKLAVYLGEISYSIYMVHLMVYTIANTLVGRWLTPQTALASFGLLSCMFFGVVMAAALAYRFVEKPCREWTRAMLK